MTDRPRDIPTYLGGTPERARDEGNNPRSAASYCAEYRIPIEDIESELEQGRTHDDMLRFCQSWWAMAEEDFKRNARKLVTRPMESRQQRRERERREEKRLRKAEKQLDEERRAIGRKLPAPPPTTIDSFSRPGGFIKDWTANDVERSRGTWNLQGWSDEDLDGMVELLAQMTDGEWLMEHGPHTRRVFALSCIHLQEVDPVKYHRLIVEGAIWENYG